MRIDDNLNIVLPIRTDDKGISVYGYHTPISRQVFEANYKILAATKSSMAAKGMHYLAQSGPFIAGLTFKDEARKESLETIGDRSDYENDAEYDAKLTLVERAFFNELKRITTILAPTGKGYELVPVDSALSQGIIDEEEWEEAASVLIFFTCHYVMARKADRAKTARATVKLLNWLELRVSSTSRSPMEFLASLTQSTKAKDSKKAE